MRKADRGGDRAFNQIKLNENPRLGPHIHFPLLSLFVQRKRRVLIGHTWCEQIVLAKASSPKTSQSSVSNAFPLSPGTPPRKRSFSTKFRSGRVQNSPFIQTRKEKMMEMLKWRHNVFFFLSVFGEFHLWGLLSL